MYKKLFLIILLLVISGCSIMKKDTQPEEKNMNMITNKKVLMIIAPKDFREEEYSEPRKKFDEEDYVIKVASIQHGEAVGVKGTKVVIDLTISEVNHEDFDAVVFVGGSGMAQITSDASLQILAERFYKAGKLTTAICIAPEILAKSGVLKGLKATAWEDSKKEIEKGGAEYIYNPVVIDRNVITANGPDAAREFAEQIIKYLER